MISKWIHLEQIGGDQWVLPVWAAVNEGVQAARVAPITPALGELGLHVSTRLNMLICIVRRVNEGVYTLYRAAGECGLENESTPKTEGVALRVADNLKYSLLADLDSLLFELNAVCELMTTLFEKLHVHAKKQMPKKTAGASIRHVLEQAGEDPSWFVQLDTHRNFFMHEGTPYVAIDTSNAPTNYDLLIMKQNLKSFDDPNKFMRLSDMNHIVEGFRQSRRVTQEHLRRLFLDEP